MPSILAIDDDRAVLHLVKKALEKEDVVVHTADNASDGLELLKKHQPDAVLLDVLMPEISGLEAVQKIHAIDRKLPVIFITAGDCSDTAIEAMKLGAFDYLLKPLDLAQVRGAVKQALETRRFMHVPVRVPTSGEPADGDGMIGCCAPMMEVYKSVGRVANQDVTVLIRGESGTGKELIARAIYSHSDRQGKPFLAVNCAALPETLLESELFGHEKGSFTGADSRRIGKFESCDGGTIFLDEIGDMALPVQAKVLRFLQNQEFQRVGGNQTVKTDVRVIAATHRDLDQMVEDGNFRADLYYRLNGFTIQIPPLRQRADDVLLLLKHFLGRYSRQLDRQVEAVAPEAMKHLLEYHWPGNIREMQSVLKQALLQSSGPVLTAESLPEHIRQPRADASRGKARLAPAHAAAPPQEGDLAAFIETRLQEGSQDLYTEALERMERMLLSRVLGQTDGNQSQAARILGITRGSLRNKLRSLGIEIGSVVTMPDDLAPEDEADDVEIAAVR
jgi:two-component system nitrogen regulation response regulator GlnG